MLIINVPFGIITLSLLANFLSTSLKKRNGSFFFPGEAIEFTREWFELSSS